MADYTTEETGVLLFSLAKVLVMEHEPSDIAATVVEDNRAYAYAIAGAAALIAWLGEFITYLILEDEDKEGEDVPN